jgi:hypothetical protein
MVFNAPGYSHPANPHKKQSKTRQRSTLTKKPKAKPDRYSQSVRAKQSLRIKPQKSKAKPWPLSQKQKSPEGLG